MPNRPIPPHARSVFLRSPLGARLRSPLGAFVCRKDIEISTAPVLLLDGEIHEITGSSFGATQGSGALEIANTPAFDDVVETQTVDSWTNKSLIFTYSQGTLPDSGMLWIKVTNDGGQSDTAIAQAGEIVQALSILTGNINGGSTGTGTVPGFNIFCGNGTGRYCYAYMTTNGNTGLLGKIAAAGYGPAISFSQNPVSARDANGFFNTTPGFYLIGATSGKVLEYGPRDHFYDIVTIGCIDATIWCSVDGLASGLASRTTSGITSSSYGFMILYESLVSPATCTTSHGWVDGEDVYLVPRYPTSIQIASPTQYSANEPGDGVEFTAYAYADEGEIGSQIELRDNATDTLLGIGSPIMVSRDLIDSLRLGISPQRLEVYAKVTNAGGQSRRTPVRIIYVFALVVLSTSPDNGTSAGGTSVTIDGRGFSSDTEIYFGGNLASSIVMVTPSQITCVTPAGTGTVDIVAIDRSQSVTLTAGFTYT